MAARSRSDIRYFVRDDDVGELTSALRTFVDTFVSHAIPVSYQIIPARFTQECADYLLGVEAAHPDLIEFGQHGLHHAMRVGGRDLKREFGPERAFSDQSATIAEGVALLKARLGAERTIRVFTPPQHKYDRSTPRAAAINGHEVFSAASYPTRHHQTAYSLGRMLNLSSVAHHGISHHGRVRPEALILDVSISVDVDDGRSIRWPAEKLHDGLRVAAEKTKTVGLMFHHAVYAGAGGEAQLAKIADLLATTAPGKFMKILDIAAEAR